MTLLSNKPADLDLLGPDDLLAWKHHPVTAQVMKVLQLWRVGILDQWAAKEFQRARPQETAEANAAALGQMELLQRILELTPADINGALHPESADAEMNAANKAKGEEATE